MNIHINTYLAIGFAFFSFGRCVADYPTLDSAKFLFSSNYLADSSLYFRGNTIYGDFLLDLEREDDKAKLVDKIAMKDFLLTTMTSIVVRVSTNVVDDGASSIPYRYDRYLAFTRAFRSFDDMFKTNVTDCLSIAAYLGRIRTASYPNDLVHIISSVVYITKDAEKRREWELKQQAWNRKRDLQCRVWRANADVRDYRNALFGICNSCVLANRRVMGDDDFAAFTNRVVELSKPSDAEKRRLFAHLDEVKRK